MLLSNITDSLKEGFEILLRSDDETIDKMLHELEKISNEADIQSVIQALSEKKIFSTNETPEVIHLLYTIYRLRDKDKETIKDIISSIYDTLIETKEKTLKPKPKFKSTLEKLLSIESLGLVFKAMGLSTEYEKTFCDARIITDIRPVFGYELKKKINSAIIVHNLKIGYHEGKDHKYFYLALESEDLQELRDMLLRAESKENLIKSNLKEKITFI